MAFSNILLLGSCVLVAGCSGIRFSSTDDGKSHPYRVASPALKVVTATDCTMTAEIISIPGRFNYLSFQTGLGKINDTVEFEPGGTIKKISANQEGVAEDLGKVIGAITGAVGAGATAVSIRGKSSTPCSGSVRVYPISVDANNNATIAQAPMLTIAAQ